ncbi:PQQ-binding-like beta-propeller repeat protein [Planctomycetota bacterium]
MKTYALMLVLLCQAISVQAQGLMVHLDCGDARETLALSRGHVGIVQGLEVDPDRVQQARDYIHTQGLNEALSVVAYDGQHLPYADNLVNRVVAPQGTQVPLNEIMRVLAPLGTARIGDQEHTKPWPQDMDQWTHFLRGPNNNAVSNDANIDLPRSLQWVDGPRWGRSHEEFASISAVVTAQGRLFYIADKALLTSIRFQGQWQLVARDAFNGMKLWSRDIPIWNDHLRHFRSGPVHLPRRLVAHEDRLYVTLGFSKPVTQLDAATGQILRTYEGTDYAEEIVFHEGVLYLLVGSSETLRIGAGLFSRNEPEPSPFRKLMAVDADSGDILWGKNAKAEDYILPLGYALCGENLYYHSIQGLGCLTAKTGKPLWFAPRPTLAKRYGFSSPTLVATPEVVLLADRSLVNRNNQLEAATGDVQWGVHGWSVSDKSFTRNGASEVKAYDAHSGEELWQAPCGEGYNSPTDVFVVGQTVWLGPFNKKVATAKGLDLKTGAVVKTIPIKGEPVGMAHDRCYRQKASVKYIFGGRDGIEYFDLDKGWIRNNSWVRGLCQYGIMPANGFMYAPPDACACHSKNRVQGFNVLNSYKAASVGQAIQAEGRLHQGLAYSNKHNLKDHAVTKGEDWTMYRADVTRSGSTADSLPQSLENKWKTPIGGRLTQPVAAYGKVYVAAIDKHTVYALDAETGQPQWHFCAGARIDSAPTLFGGQVFFGSADGRVYCLDAISGELAWRFNAAPEDRSIMVQGQVESCWPVHGAVLVQNNELYFTAGRSSYLDGGIRFYRLNPATGEMLSAKTITTLDPETEEYTGFTEKSFDSAGTINDVLSGDEDKIFLKHLALDKTGNQSAKPKDHLFSAGGFLGEQWFVRAYWLYGNTMKSGWGGWADSANEVPFGRIMCLDPDRLYGYGRVRIASGKVGHTLDAYHLYASEKKVASSNKTFLWSEDIKLIVRAMVSTGQSLVLAGVPDVGRRTDGLLAYDNEADIFDALDGNQGTFLRLYDKTDGHQLAQYPLTDIPVFDGMICANQKLFISLTDGSLVCWGN